MILLCFKCFKFTPQIYIILAQNFAVAVFKFAKFSCFYKNKVLKINTSCL